jgi:hypothetical protein
VPVVPLFMLSVIVSVDERVTEKPEPVKPTELEPGVISKRISTCPAVVAAGNVSALPSVIK